MADYVLIACGKTKRETRCRAADLYLGALFRKSMAYARRLQPDGIFILSAKHGLLEPDTIIDPYELSLKQLSLTDRKSWSKRILESLDSKTDLEKDRFTILAGQDYRRQLVSRLKLYNLPLEGMRLGEQLAWLSK